MKRTILSLVALLFAGAILVGCSNEVPDDNDNDKYEESDKNTDNGDIKDDETDKNDSNNDEDESIRDDNTDDNDLNDDESIKEKLPDFKTKATIEETVLINENGIVIKATGLAYEDYSIELNLSIENNTNQNLGFSTCAWSCAGNSINGFMIDDAYLSCDVGAGKKSKESISFSYDELRLLGITEIADIELNFSVTNDDYDEVYSELTHIKTSIANEYVYLESCYRDTIVSDAAKNTYNFTVPYFVNQAIYNKDGISVKSGGFIVDEEGETALVLEVTNSTAEWISVGTSDICINGLCVENSLWSSDVVNSGKTKIINIDLSSMMDKNSWAVYGLTDIGSVSLDLVFEDAAENAICDPVQISLANPNITLSYNKDGQELYNANGIKIVMKGIIEDEYDFSDDIIILLLVENRSGQMISIYEVYDSFSINGYMMDCSIPMIIEMPSGTTSVFEIELWESDLEENDITSIEDIIDIEFSIEITDTKWDEIDTPVILINNAD